MSARTVVSVIFLAVASFIAAGAAAQEPTLHEVYQAAQAGNFAEAQRMMDQVLRDHPNSAKAHYVEAELLAKQGRFAAAESELATAERLEAGRASSDDSLMGVWPVWPKASRRRFTIDLRSCPIARISMV